MIIINNDDDQFEYLTKQYILFFCLAFLSLNLLLLFFLLLNWETGMNEIYFDRWQKNIWQSVSFFFILMSSFDVRCLLSGEKTNEYFFLLIWHLNRDEKRRNRKLFVRTGKDEIDRRLIIRFFSSIVFNFDLVQ